MARSSSPSKRTSRPAINRDKIKQSWADIHPGIPLDTRLEMILHRVIDAICDEIEGK